MQFVDVKMCPEEIRVPVHKCTHEELLASTYPTLASHGQLDVSCEPSWPQLNFSEAGGINVAASKICVICNLKTC